MYDKLPSLYTLALSLFWPQCAHAQLNPFYHPFYPDVTQVRKDTRPPHKAGRGLGMKLEQAQ